ncbi:Uracil-DNA glycosylase, partial [Stegodyphus mimosarum]
MLPSIQGKNPLLTRMSQNLITSFFKPPQGVKRKHDHIEESESTNDNKIEKSSVDDGITSNSASIRATIIALAKQKPALSPNIGLTWFIALKQEFSKKYFDELGKFLTAERERYTLYPPVKDIYFWTNTVKIQDVKVVILGQDPYHGPGQAHGLAFSVRKGVPCPPSLINIYKELSTDIPDFQMPSHGYLYGWASQGVLLLNACLTVRASCANSHQNKGWENLTDSVIVWINNNLPHTVFLLWGGNAKQKAALIKKEKHLILTAAHPSPLSAYRGFFGCQHFSKANEYLKQ